MLRIESPRSSELRCRRWSAGKGREMMLEVISWWLGVGETLRDERAMATLVLQGSTAVRWSDHVSDPSHSSKWARCQRERGL